MREGTGSAEALAADLESAARASIDTEPVEIVPGLWSMPVEIPIPSLKVVNVYAMELSGGGVAVVDTGWDSDESWESLKASLACIGHAVEDVRTVVVTHAHPDHLGLAYRLVEEAGAQVLVSDVEAARLSGGAGGPLRFREALQRTYPTWGVPAPEVTAMLAQSTPSSEASWLTPVVGIRDGELLDLPGWSVRGVWTPGHTQGHLCLHDARNRLLYTGDHVLPRITPGIGVHPAGETDALGDFLASLAKVATLDVDLVLPGHEYRFPGLRNRVEALLRHHEDRLDEVDAVVRAEPGVSCWQVTQRIEWSRPLERFAPSMVRAAVAETMSHLVRLERLGRLERRNPARGTGDGAARWVPSAT